MRLGATIDVQILSAGGRRPAVLLCPPFPDLAARLARAGYAVVSVHAADQVTDVLAALAQGALGFQTSAVGVIGATPPVAVAVPWLEYSNDPDAAVRWCAEQLAC